MNVRRFYREGIGLGVFDHDLAALRGRLFGLNLRWKDTIY